MSYLLSMLNIIIPKSKIGIILTMILSRTASPIIKQILDKQNQQVAYYFVLDLNKRKDLTNKEKAHIFNLQMFEWSKKMGKEICSSVINCLRELAVNVVKTEQEQ